MVIKEKKLNKIGYYFQVQSGAAYIQGRLLFDCGVIFLGNGKPSGIKVLLRQCWCGHHVYKTIWTPFSGEILTAIPEPQNNHDRHTCALRKGHKSPVMFFSLSIALHYASPTLEFSSHQFHVSKWLFCWNAAGNP